METLEDALELVAADAYAVILHGDADARYPVAACRR
jgi:hypothetical protein